MGDVTIGGMPHSSGSGGAGNNYFNDDLVSDGNHTHSGEGNNTIINDVLQFLHTSSQPATKHAWLNIQPHIIELFAENTLNSGNETSIQLTSGNEDLGIVFNETSFGKYQFITPPFHNDVEEYSLQLGRPSSGRSRIYRQYTKVVNTIRVRNIASGDSPYTVDPLVDNVLFVDTTGGAIIINFPRSVFVAPNSGAAVSSSMGVNNGSPIWFASHEIIIKLANDPSSNNLTLEPDGSETIQDIGASATSNLILLASGDEGGSWRIVTDGSNLHVI